MQDYENSGLKIITLVRYTIYALKVTWIRKFVVNSSQYMPFFNPDTLL